MNSDPNHHRSDVDPVEDLMVQCLTLPEREQSAAVEAACVRYPEFAEVLRRRLAALRTLGLVPQPPEVPQLGRYQLGERLGGGGMGVVHRARDLSLGRDVAIKWIRPEQTWLPHARARFRREVEAIAALAHPGIVTVLGVGDDDQVPWFAMELVDGAPLTVVLAELSGHAPEQMSAEVWSGSAETRAAAVRAGGGRGCVAATVRLVLQVVDALAHVHARGIIHRDVKPSNIMLDREGRTRLIDFGLAHLAVGDSMTRTGTQPGSLAYMSPEQVRGEEVDARTDVWSAGAVLYECLTLRAPFTQHTDAATRAAVLAAHPPALRALNRGVGRDLAAVLATALAPERNRRYATMARFADDLRAVLARQPVAARRPTGLLRTLRYLQRHPVRALTTALLLLSALLPAALWWQERAARAAIQAQVVRAERAEQRSRADAASAWELVEFLENIFRDATPDYGEGRSASLRDALERGVREIRFGAHRDPALRARLLEAMARACLHTGWFSEAAALTDEADNLIGQLPAVDDGERRQRLWHRAQVRLVQRRYAEHSALLAALLADGPLSDPVLWASACVAQGTEQARQDQLAAARRSLVAGVAAMRRNVVAGDPRLASPLLELATLLQRVEGRAAAEPLVQEASALVEPLPLGHPTRFSTVCRVTWFHENWGEHRTALRMARDGLTAAESYGVAPRHPLRGVLHRIAARQALYLDDMSAALSHAESAVDLLRGASRGSDHDLVRAISTAASAALALGDVARARGHVDEALQLGAVLPEPDPGLLATVHATRASVLVEEGDAQVALAAIEQSQALGCQAPTLPPAFGVTTSVNLARAQVRTGRKDLARETLRSVVAALNAPDLPQAWTMGLWLAQVAWLHTQLGDVDQGEQYARRALDVLGRCEASVSRPAAVAWKHLGYAQLQKRELRAAAASLERSLELHRQLLPQDKWFNVLDLLTNAYMWSNQNAQAEATLLLALSLGESASGRGFGSNDRRASLARVRCVLGRRTEAAADIDVVLDGFLTSAPPTREAAQYAIETALRIADGHDDPDVRTQRLVRLATVASRVLPSEHVLCGRIRAALDRRSGG